MSIHIDTQCYERRLGKQCTVDKAALKQKHKRMCEDAFVFLRATYYRWARKIDDWCPELHDAPHVLAIGDLHTENYGTWRDGQGRLVWGVNDFDEAASMPYVLDLVRLATSAALAPRRLLPANETCRAILEGYRGGLDDPRPMLLEENGAWMRDLAVCTRRKCDAFWEKVAKFRRDKPPADVEARLQKTSARCEYQALLHPSRRRRGSWSAASPCSRGMARRADSSRGQSACSVGVGLGARPIL